MEIIFVNTTPSYLKCLACGKQVSTGFYPVQTDTPDKGIIIRAFIQCPECMEKEAKEKGETDGLQ